MEEFTYKDGVLTINWAMYKRAMSIIGAKGGRSRSPAKSRASRANAKKAVAARMAKLGKAVKQ